MKIERLIVPAFGTLRDVDTGDGVLPGLVVVQGPNESGKSTFFEALTTLLYGFSPAARDRHPYTPWDGDDPDIRARLVTEEGVPWKVKRRLLKTATGRATSGDEERQLRNRPLDGVERIPREIYRRVFALTLEDLTALDAESWDQLQERLLSRMGARDILPARQVIEELEEEAGRIWRPNRRGNQRVREIRDEIRELMRNRRDASENDRRIRGLHRDAEKATLRLAELREERERTRLLVDRVTVLAPLRRKLERLTELERVAASGPAIDDLPADVRDRLDALEASRTAARERVEELAAARREPALVLERFTEGMRRTLQARREIVDAVSAASKAESLETNNAQLSQQLNDLDRRIASGARELFRAPLDPEMTEQLMALPTGELVARVDRWQQLRRQAEEHRRTEETRPTLQPRTAAVGGALALVGLVLLTISQSRLTTVSGGLLLAAGVALLAQQWPGLRGRGSDADGPSPEAVSEAERRVRELLDGLPLHERDLDREFVSRLGRQQELIEDRAVRRRQLEEDSRRVESAARSIGELGRRLGLELPAHLGTAAHQLDRSLTEAERAEEAAGGARRELERLDAALARAEADEAEVTAESDRLRDTLSGLGNGNPEVGLEHIARRQQAASDARHLRADIEREHPDLALQRERIRTAEEEGASWLEDDEALVRARRRVDETTEAIEELAARVEGLNREVAHLQEGVTTDQIDGRIAGLKEDEVTAVRDRDRRIVLAAVLRRADREFREKNDPDVIERASEHLGALTHGRYRELIAPEADPSGPLQVIDPETGQRVDVGNLSKGTREQVYFSLRLALMDHLDADGERLPVMVDEAFVNWDPARRDRLLGILERLTRVRQVFVFTCHPEWGARLEEAGGRIVQLAEWTE